MCLQASYLCYTHLMSELAVEGIRQSEKTKALETQNPFGFPTPGFQELDNTQKRVIWLDQGGRNFEGEFGDVKRYVIGIPRNALEFIQENGFDVNRKREKLGSFGILVPFMSKHLGGTEGKGVYATTNPVLAAREYGPALAVVDIALGKSVTPDNNTALKLLNMLHGPLFAGTSGYSLAAFVTAVASINVIPREAYFAIMASAGAAQLLPTSIFRIFQIRTKADSMIVKPRHYWTVINKLGQFLRGKQSMRDLLEKVEKHKEWVVVKDPKRVKVVHLFPNYEQYTEQEAVLIPTVSSLAPAI